MIDRHGGASNQTCVVDQFTPADLGAPFKVVLHDSVEVTFGELGEVTRYKIPDLDGLLSAIVITRVLHRCRLSGPELKFLRKASGIKQKVLASKVDISTEHLSRCEAGMEPVSRSTEKLLRVYILKTAMKLHKAPPCEQKVKLEDALDRLFDALNPVSVRSIDDELVLHFWRKVPEATPENNEDITEHAGYWNENVSLVA